MRCVVTSSYHPPIGEKERETMETKTVVLYPGLSVSHFIPMMRLAGPLLDHGYAVSVALIDTGVNHDIAFRAVVRRVAASMPSVRFHTLPAMQDPPKLAQDGQFLLTYLHLLSRYNERLHDFLRSMRVVHAVVVDSLSNAALTVVKKLGIPAYTLFTSSAATLVAFAQLPAVVAEGGASFKELGDTPLELLGLPPMPASHLSGEVLEDPESDTYKTMMALLRRIPEADGTLVNTFESLEARAVAALRDPRCVPAGWVLPPVYCVGPFVGSTADAEAKERHECLAWLDGQPDCRVVFLCFGSVGAGNHPAEQLREIADGLEKSGHRFLWVVRAPANDDPEKPHDPRADPDLDALLPDGFMERTNGRGLVVKLWAPQLEVLRHRATGAFVTHCGWNSVLEGVTAGVPMLCWPLYSEQKMNKVHMVGDMGIAAEMVGWQQGLVKAGEVEAKVRLVMESEEGRVLRERAAAHKEAAAAACNDGGSSRLAFARFLADVDGRQEHACSGEVDGA